MKKKLISTLVVAGAIVGLALPVMAQKAGERTDERVKQGPRFERVKQMRQNLMDRLNLSEAQKAQFAALRQSQIEQMRSFREQIKNGTADRSAVRPHLSQMRKDRREAMKSILTPEQQAQLGEIRKSKRATRGDRTKDRGERRLRFKSGA